MFFIKRGGNKQSSFISHTFFDTSITHADDVDAFDGLVYSYAIKRVAPLPGVLVCQAVFLYS